MLGRIGLVIHWFGFFVGIFFGGVWVLTIFGEWSLSTPNYGLKLIGGTVAFWLVPHSLAWLIRYILAGSVPFMPWAEFEEEKPTGAFEIATELNSEPTAQEKFAKKVEETKKSLE